MKSKSKLSFTINRAKWRSGGEDDNMTGHGVTELQNKEGYRCCLGFACLAAGFKVDDILRHGEPGSIGDGVLKGKKSVLINEEGGNSTFSTEAISINDCMGYTREAREERLIRLGKKHQVEIKFKGKYVI